MMMMMVLAEIVARMNAKMLANCVFDKLELIEKKASGEELGRVYIPIYSHRSRLFFV
jgi:hypothetical protein